MLDGDDHTRRSATRRSFLVAAGTAAIASAVAAQTRSGNAGHRTLSSAEKEKQAFPFLTLKMFVETSSEETNGVVSIVRGHDARLQMPRDVARLNQIYAKYGPTNLPPASLPLSAGG